MRLLSIVLPGHMPRVDAGAHVRCLGPINFVALGALNGVLPALRITLDENNEVVRASSYDGRP